MAATESTGACPHCDGRGWTVEDDGGVGTARRCPCQVDELGPRLLEAAGIPTRYRGCRLENFQASNRDPAVAAQLKKAVADCRRYLDGFGEGGVREKGLIFVGPPGGGKTHLAVAVLKELIDRYRVQGRFVEFTSLVHDIQRTFDGRTVTTKQEVLDPVIRAEVLVLDELGAQNPTPWVQDILYLIINSRYTERRATLFSTNYRLDRPSDGRAAPRLDRGPEPDDDPARRYGLLAHRLPPMLVSRLYEMAQPVRLDAAGDFRQEVQVHRHRI